MPSSIGVPEDARHRHRHRRSAASRRSTNGSASKSIGPGCTASTCDGFVLQQHAEVAAVGRVAGQRHHLGAARRQAGRREERVDPVAHVVSAQRRSIDRSYRQLADKPLASSSARRVRPGSSCSAMTIAAGTRTPSVTMQRAKASRRHRPPHRPTGRSLRAGLRDFRFALRVRRTVGSRDSRGSRAANASDVFR